MAMLNIISRGLVEDDDGHTGGGGEVREPYQMLSDNERDLVDAARSAAAEGVDAYGDWFKELESGARGFLAYNKAGDGQTWHSQNKELAAKA